MCDYPKPHSDFVLEEFILTQFPWAAPCLQEAYNKVSLTVSPADVLGVLVAGGCAGVLAWAVATPMDVIKSRLQADGQGQQRYRGLLHCVVTSVREEGPRVLFKGLALNCCRAFPVNMVVFVAYEAVLRLTQSLLT